MRPHGGAGLDLGGGGRRIHLLGIGGSGMSAIASVLVALGHEVSGSDEVASAALERLDSLGVVTFVGHREANVIGADLVGVSTAISDDNVELVHARRLGIPCHHRYDLLEAIGSLRSTLSVSGTHGKTTTSALLAMGLQAAGVEPGFIIGATVPRFATGSRWTDGEWFVLEADESDSTFLAPPRRGCIVTNVEADHLDHHGSFDALLGAFERFISGTRGPAVVWGDDPHADRLAGASADTITYGEADHCDAVISDIEERPDGSSWTLEWGDRRHVLRIGLPGRHLVLNATAAVVLGSAIGLDIDGLAPGIAEYRGVGRRYEHRGTVGGVTLIDDYAHLPTEVETVLGAARQSAPRRVVAVFQPHRFSRTRDHHLEYATAFDHADVVVLTEVYPAGEDPLPGISGRLVVDALTDARPDADVRWAPTRADLLAVLTDVLVEGDLCITMGAGDLTTLPSDLADLLAVGGARGSA